MASTFAAKPQALLRETGNMFAVALEGFRRTWDVKQWWKEYVEQCWFIAKVTSVPVVLISIPFGMVIALHVGSFSRQLGAESSTGAAMVLAIVREAAPVATALLIAGAGGSAMTADLGSRKIRDEIAAMEVMAVNPVHRLVTPRLWASATISMLLVSSGASRVTRVGYYFTLSLLKVGGAWRVDDVVTLAYNPSTTGSGVTPPSASAPATTAPTAPPTALSTSGPSK